MILDGKAIAQRVTDEVRAGVAEFVAAGHTAPGLAVVLVGENAASHVYVRNKRRTTETVGMRSFAHDLPADTTEDTLLALIDRLNADPAVNGILVQLPLPKHLDADAVINAIPPHKDVDGLHPDNLGRVAQDKARYVACTPQGCMRLIALTGIELAGASAVVIGRSVLVGKPVAMLLSNASATVTLCHSKTRNLADVVRAADIVVAAVGRPEMVKGDWIKPGAIVIDVGINRVTLPDGTKKTVGDVKFDEVKAKAAYITPVPGGVGPMTVAMLLKNTLRSAELLLKQQK